MNKKEKINKKLIDLLLKKASGFHYEEEQCEYQVKGGKKTPPKYQNISFFDDGDRGFDVFDETDDKLKLINCSKEQKNEGLVLVKKKVTSRYIPPDMLAIKILLEMFGKEKIDDLSVMTDEEILALKKVLFEELKKD